MSFKSIKAKFYFQKVLFRKLEKINNNRLVGWEGSNVGTRATLSNIHDYKRVSSKSDIQNMTSQFWSFAKYMAPLDFNTPNCLKNDIEKD